MINAETVLAVFLSLIQGQVSRLVEARKPLAAAPGNVDADAGRHHNPPVVPQYQLQTLADGLGFLADQLFREPTGEKDGKFIAPQSAHNVAGPKQTG